MREEKCRMTSKAQTVVELARVPFRNANDRPVIWKTVEGRKSSDFHYDGGV